MSERGCTCWTNGCVFKTIEVSFMRQYTGSSLYIHTHICCAEKFLSVFTVQGRPSRIGRKVTQCWRHHKVLQGKQESEWKWAVCLVQIIGTALGVVIGPCIFFIFYRAFPIGDPNGMFPAPYATIYRAMAILGTQGLNALPMHCTQLFAAFFCAAVLMSLSRVLPTFTQACSSS